MTKKVIIILISFLLTVAMSFVFFRKYKKPTSAEDSQTANSANGFLNCVLDRKKHKEGPYLFGWGDSSTIGFNEELSAQELKIFTKKYQITSYNQYSTVNAISAKRWFGWFVTTVCRVEQDSRVRYINVDGFSYATN